MVATEWEDAPLQAGLDLVLDLELLCGFRLQLLHVGVAAYVCRLEGDVGWGERCP